MCGNANIGVCWDLVALLFAFLMDLAFDGDITDIADIYSFSTSIVIEQWTVILFPFISISFHITCIKVSLLGSQAWG